MAFTTPLNGGKVAANGGTTRALPSFNATAGSTVVVYVADSSGNTASVTDNKGATYTQRAAIAGTSAKLWVFTTTNHPGGAGCVITVTFGGSADSACAYQEWPASTVDTASLVTATTGTSPFVTESNALASASSVVLLAGSCDQGGTVNYTESTGFTKNQEETNGTNYWTLATFFKVVAATSAVSSSLGMNNGNPADNGNRVIFALTEAGGGGATVSPSGIASAAALGAPAVRAGLAPSGVATAAAYGSPTVLPVIALAPTGIATSSAAGAPAASVTASPGGIATNAAVGAPSLGAGLTPAGVATSSALGAPTVAAAGGIVAQGIASGAAYGAPALAVTLAPAGVATVSAIGQPSAGAALAAVGIVSGAGYGTPTVSLTSGILPAGIATVAAYGVPVLGVGLAPAGAASLAAFGTPAVMGTHTLAPAGVASVAAFGLPLVYDPNDTGPSEWVHWTMAGESQYWNAPGEGQDYRIRGESPIWKMTP